MCFLLPCMHAFLRSACAAPSGARSSPTALPRHMLMFGDPLGLNSGEPLEARSTAPTHAQSRRRRARPARQTAGPQQRRFPLRVPSLCAGPRARARAAPRCLVPCPRRRMPARSAVNTVLKLAGPVVAALCAVLLTKTYMHEQAAFARAHAINPFRLPACPPAGAFHPHGQPRRRRFLHTLINYHTPLPDALAASAVRA
jgi:hypothetical protein